MGNYLVHKAVELDKVKVKRRETLSAPGYLEEHYIAQAKYDGCNSVVLLDHDGAHVFSRTGETVRSMDHVLEALLALPDVKLGAYLGEAWNAELDFPTISGHFRRHDNSPLLQQVIFDYLTPDEWHNGKSTLGYTDRVARLPNSLAAVKMTSAPVYLGQSFGRIVDTWPQGTTQSVCNALVEAGGYDGLILRQPDGKWERGSGTSGEILKVKRKLSLALRVTGLVVGKGKHSNRLGALTVAIGQHSMEVGTGFSDKEREDFYNYPDEIIGKIVEVEALDYTAGGTVLREPRYKGIRWDVTEPDA